MFCLLCGKDEALTLNLCWDCFCKRERLASIPNLVSITMCSRCGAVAKGKHWVDTNGEMEALQAVIDEKLTIHTEVVVASKSFDIEQEDRNTFVCRVLLDIRPLSGSGNSDEELTTRLRIKDGVCTRCSRMAGNYFEAILQLRGTSRELDGQEKEECIDFVVKTIALMSHNSKDVFLSRIDEIHGGLDFYLGNSSSGRTLSKEITQRFGGLISSSSQLTGKQDGRDLYRTTYLVRLPSYRLGDFIDHDGETLWVIGISRGNVKAWKLGEGKEVSIPIKNLVKVKVLAGLEDVKEGIIVSQHRGELQVMEPTSYRTIVLIEPHWFQEDMSEKTDDRNGSSGVTIPIISLDGDLLMLPRRLLAQVKIRGEKGA